MNLVNREELIDLAIAGKVISFPTDTVPALAVLPKYSEAIFAAKKRPAHKPLILMAGTINDIWDYVIGTELEKAIWQFVAEQYLPGALTLVLPASDKVNRAIDPSNLGTIGIRIPDLFISREILAKTGALATTSANLSGAAPLEFMSEIAANFPEVAVLNCQELETIGKIGSGMPSTVAKWTGEGWEILRQGGIQLPDRV
jgi:L-threonylcarbamoyladenylate synthase